MSSVVLENYKNANCVIRSHVERLVQAVAENIGTDRHLFTEKQSANSLIGPINDTTNDRK